ncbi:hypothetical protein GGE07_002874 [Sinorhizobium terangae]|nr:hypothetical protein [Sinorhizobium terangae]
MAGGKSKLQQDITPRVAADLRLSSAPLEVPEVVGYLHP